MKVREGRYRIVPLLLEDMLPFAELQGKLEVMTAEAERANERWQRAVTENKSLKSRWEKTQTQARVPYQQV